MRQVNLLPHNEFGPICIMFFSQRASRAGSRNNSRAGSRADTSMSNSIHQARFGSRSFISSKSNLMSSSRKNLASDSMRFQKPVAQVWDTCIFMLSITAMKLLLLLVAHMYTATHRFVQYYA